MTNTVILDVDGTLLDWKSTYLEWLQSFNLIHNYNGTDYSFKKYISIPDGEKFLQPSTSDFSDALSEIFNQTHLLGKLAPIPGAIKAIKKFRDAGFRLKVVSSYTTQYEAMKLREKNLITVFGDVFEEITSLPLHSSKKEYLNKQDKNSIFIEDSISQLMDAIEVGFDSSNCFLIPAPYNADEYNNLFHHTNEVRFSRMNWNEIIKTILG